MGWWKKWTHELRLAGRSKDDDSEDVSVDEEDRQRRPSPRRSAADDVDPDQRQIKPTWCDYLLLDKRIRFFYVVVLFLILGIVCPALISFYLAEYQADLTICSGQSLYKFECGSGTTATANGSVTEDMCLAAGCCWNPQSSPRCFHTSPTRYAYHVSEVKEQSASKIHVRLRANLQRDPYGNVLPEVEAIIRAVNPHHLVIQLLDVRKSSPDDFRLLSGDNQTEFEQSDFSISVTTDRKKTFGVVVSRKSTGQVLIDTNRGPLTLSDQYVELSTTLPSEYIYGLGSDHRTSFHRNFNFVKSALYSRAGADGFHPFYMGLEPEGFAHGVFWDNTHPLEVQLSQSTTVSFRASGGAAVLHLLSGPTPADVSKQLMDDVIGPIRMPPFWALGFHLCRQSDDAGEAFKQTLDGMTSAKVSFDSDCIDLNLSGPGSGGVDLGRFPQAKEQRGLLQSNGKKFVLTQPPHVAQVDDSTSGGEGWILDRSNQSLIGVRMNASVLYPSFPEIQSSIDVGPPPSGIDRDAMLDPDGVHLVDNWPSNEDRRPDCSTDRLRSFIPDKLRNSLTEDTLCADSLHSGGREHIQLHNHYGAQHLLALVRQQEAEVSDSSAGSSRRLLYLNRASALANLGLAGYSGDDFSANWVSMKMALIQVMEYGLYGIPLSGAPICGSTNSSGIDGLPSVDEEQLCIRWYQMGLLLPLAHSTTKLNQRRRSPVDWSPNTRRILAGYIQQRYRLLPYFYTLLFQASKAGTPVVRPMFYQFPRDNETYLIEDQFMIGDAIMVCPVTVQQQDQKESVPLGVYFPAGTWYDYYSGDFLIETQGAGVNITTPLTHINMFVRNASVLVTQEPGRSAEETRANPYTVTVGFPLGPQQAEGYLYVDDGITTDPDAFDLIHFRFSDTKFVMELISNRWSASQKTDEISAVVDGIRILGLLLTEQQLPTDNRVNYDRDSRVLYIDQLNFDWTKSETYEYTFVQ